MCGKTRCLMKYGNVSTQKVPFWARNEQKIIEIIGWYGTIAIVSAYALSSFGMLRSSDFLYQLLNFTGAIGIVIDAFSKKDYQPGVLNVIWAVIALVAVVKILFVH